MKKTLFLIIIIIFIYVLIGNVCEKNNLIKDNSIRIRIIASSNSEYDQAIKLKVKDRVIKNLYPKLENLETKEMVRKTIKNNLNNIDSDVKYILDNYNETYKINYGMNYFPEKKYKKTIYKEGYYESLVITIGKGKGKNYWCFLYPPLCMMEIDESSDVKYTTILSEIVSSHKKKN